MLDKLHTHSFACQKEIKLAPDKSYNTVKLHQYNYFFPKTNTKTNPKEIVAKWLVQLLENGNI